MFAAVVMLCCVLCVAAGCSLLVAGRCLFVVVWNLSGVAIHSLSFVVDGRCLAVVVSRSLLAADCGCMLFVGC